MFGPSQLSCHHPKRESSGRELAPRPEGLDRRSDGRSDLGRVAGSRKGVTIAGLGVVVAALFVFLSPVGRLPVGDASAPRVALAPDADPPSLSLEAGDRIVVAGNTFAERMQLYGFFEGALHCRYPDLRLVVRNLGWSGDEVDLMPRPANFGSFTEHLKWQRADVALLCFGLNESFAGPSGLEAWRERLSRFLREIQELRTGADATKTLRLALLSPIAHEDLGAPLPTGEEVVARNEVLAAYVTVMKEVAHAESVPFVDLFTPTRQAMESAKTPWTINGIHLHERGYHQVSRWIVEGLGLPARDQTARSQESPESARERARELRVQIIDKNHHFFLFWRPLNPFYIWGGRAYCWKKDEPMVELEEIGEMVRERDRRVHSLPKPSIAHYWDAVRPTPGEPELWESTRDYSRERTATAPPLPPRPDVRRNGVIK